MKFKTGDKIIIKSKTTPGYKTLIESGVFRRGKGYGYIIKYQEGVEHYLVSEDKNEIDGDYFHEKDLIFATKEAGALYNLRQ